MPEKKQRRRLSIADRLAEMDRRIKSHEHAIEVLRERKDSMERGAVAKANEIMRQVEEYILGVDEQVKGAGG